MLRSWLSSTKFLSLGLPVSFKWIKSQKKLNNWYFEIAKYYSIFSFTDFFVLEQIKIEIFNISQNNIISVNAAKVVGWIDFIHLICEIV